MHRPLAVLALACLAGCAASPQDVRGAGTRTEQALKLAPAQAAGCIAGNAENASRGLLSRGFAASIRPLQPADSFEVTLRMPEWSMVGVSYVFEITPSGTASKASIWGPADEMEFRAEATSGC